MKNIFLSLALLTSCALFADTAVKIDGVRKCHIAVVDVQQIVNFENPKESALVEWQDVVGNLQTDIEKRRNKLQEKQEKFQKEVSEIKDPQNMPEKEQERLSKKAQEIQREGQELQGYMQQELSKIQASIADKVKVAAKDVAQTLGYTHAAMKDVFLFVEESFDITKQVIEALNKKYQAEQRAKKVVNKTEKKS